MILIQPPREPREQHLGEVWATQNFIKDYMIRRVNICTLVHFWENGKKETSFLVNYLKMLKHLCLFWVDCEFKFNFFTIFSNAPDYIDSSGHFVLNEYIMTLNLIRICLSTKSWRNCTILSYLIVLFFVGAGFHNPNSLEIKKISFQISGF